MTYLLANGCSYTDENYGGYPSQYIHTYEEKDKLGIPRVNWKMWPEYVAERMDVLHLNLGVSGGSNYRMYSTSVEQIQRKKPKILMHLWTSSNRSNYHSQKYHDSDFVSAVFYAAELMNHNGNIFLEEGMKTGFHRSNGKNAFQAIQLFYPEKLEETFKFYESFHSDDEGILKLLSDCRKNIVDVNDLPIPSNNARHLKATLMKTWIQYMNFSSYSSRDICHRMADQMITRELEPILQTYYMAKLENIPFVSIFGLPLSLHKLSLRFSKKLAPYELIIQKIIDGDQKSTSIRNPGRRFIDLIDNGGLNRFEIIILFNQYLHQIANNITINNPIFIKLDDLIAEKKFITKCWPPFPPYGLDRREIEKCITKNWKPLSDRDIHPSPDTQKYIGDAFYDLYQENYS